MSVYDHIYNSLIQFLGRCVLCLIMSDNGDSESLKADDILKNLTAEKKKLVL